MPSNLLIQFVDDNIDQTPQLASTLDAASVTTSSVDGKSQVTVRMLPGDHVRPLRQAFGDLPPEIAQVAEQAVTQGSYFLKGLSNMATQAGFAEVRNIPNCPCKYCCGESPPYWFHLFAAWCYGRVISASYLSLGVVWQSKYGKAILKLLSELMSNIAKSL